MFMNVYRPDGTALFLALPIASHAEVSSVLRRAYYEHGLVKPDYDVFRCPEVARARA